jgi:glycosyltransferase involved in cell wall biosynthesis
MIASTTNKLVSVVIPTYNREKYLEEAIVSVINQTYNCFEILVIDDGSDKNYAELICSKYDKCTYLYKQNGGLSSARNFGIKHSKGDYIAFLDDDDYWRSDKLEKQVVVLENNIEVDCVHSSASIVDENSIESGKVIGASNHKAHKRSGYVFWNALGVWVVKSPTPLIRKSVFADDLLFDETIKVGEDIDFYQRMFYRHKVKYINEPLAFYREYENTARLSKQLKKYVGVEKKQFVNLKKMNIKNPISIYFITLRLAKAAQKRINLINENYNSLFFKIKLIIRPKRYLNYFSNLLHSYEN